LRDFDLIGITLPHELCYTNILEALDLAGIELHASSRADSDAFVIGGGPCAFNPEPVAKFFDAILVGEGEEAMAEIIGICRQARQEGLSRPEALERLLAVEGLYVPALHRPSEGEGLQTPIVRRLFKGFAAAPGVRMPLIPFTEVVHDRLVVEIARGCARGCRFCQAGMMYRPVRERDADSVVSLVNDGLAATGYDEVSLTSLSATDHSQIADICRRVIALLDGTDVSLSLPSQRLDAFGVQMASLVSGGGRKTGLTFAPEAATQRLRDAINKNVSADDLVSAVKAAYQAGWRRCKLYFMIGLPSETDEDVCAIASLANLAYETALDSVADKERPSVRMGVSVALFVPKPHTPFQWCGQITREEAGRRVALIRKSGLRRGIDLRWHDPASSLIEAVMSRGDASIAALVEAAWRKGACFDAWSDRFSLDRWLDAASGLGIDMEALAGRDYCLDEPLPWGHVSTGVSEEYLKMEHERAFAGLTTPDCTFASCTSCGACEALGAAKRAAWRAAAARGAVQP
jgi:radical SAM family uncharacterized protein